MEPVQILLILGSASVGGLITFFLTKGGASKVSPESIKKEAQNLIKESREQAETLRKKAKSEITQVKQAAKEENERLEAHLNRLQESSKLKEKHVNERVSKNKEILSWLKVERQMITEMQTEIKQGAQKTIEVLLENLGVTKGQAIAAITKKLTNEILARKESFVKNRTEEAEEDSLKRAKNILIGTIQRYSDKSSVDHNQTFVEVKQERFKLQLVGPKCENVSHLEKRSDVEIIFNDYPKIITIGGFNLVRRHIVKSAIEILQKHRGNITPKDIDESLKKAQKTVGKIMVSKAREAVRIVGIKNIPDGVLKHIGRLHFRTSYGQNALRHSLEVGMFAGLIAAEVGADVKKAREAGFLHDIGKALSEESDKGHDVLTKEILEENGYPEDIVHAAWAHHEGEQPNSLEAKIIMAADALSASRPGARLESLERYLQRIRELEETAASFPGIQKTFALSAGREVRVMVNPDEIHDDNMSGLAHDIAEKIENKLSYPGNIKINVIRKMLFKARASGSEEKAKK
ncbi:DUF3552 domain-containing protein [Candidatus Peregrinibacteria bacterium]|jgi:ribonucrease Y|nr:DUF3552 domain-containing protein [Candidatus Peregrinibacteria bacterium]MBT7484038.1 DUF3552 domain-containing protein [Candidatus Peregrinibacteria bacterium]MBT7703503.1 DUF3552 domain-containing protein [Candidatus Peregrinibacteria bacterium]